MNSKLFYLMLFFTSCSYCQEVITIDFSSKNKPDLEKASKLSPGDFYKIKVDNINPNLYKINFANENIEITPQLTLPTFKDISLDGLAKLTSAFTTTANLVGINNLETAPDLVVKVSSLMLSFPIIKIADPINKKIDDYSNKSKNYTETLAGIKKNYDKVKLDFYKFRIDKYQKVNINNAYNVDKAFKDFENIRNSFGVIKDDISTFQNVFETFINTDKVKKHLDDDANKNDKENVDKIISFFKEINIKINEFIEAVSAENVDKALKSIVFLSNETSFTSLPIQFYKDQVKVTLTFTPVEEAKNYLQTESMTFNFPATMRDYWSVGTSFYYAFNMKNERFSSIGSTDTNDVTTYRIKKEDDINEEFGTALMLRYGWKWQKNVGYHFLFGPGISIEKDIKPRLLIGGGLSLGKKHSVTLDAGLMAGYVNRKSNIVDLNEIYSEKPENLTVTKLDYSPFLSLGYMYKL